ncbi:uracil-DNA glycosylase [Treponema sp. HNW]|uniref:uracil-DNA glycosylase n=1 Tax=Treponema sp. HNW TaxID=3116654 RepID=UPI003D0AE4D4
MQQSAPSATQLLTDILNAADTWVSGNRTHRFEPQNLQKAAASVPDDRETIPPVTAGNAERLRLLAEQIARCSQCELCRNRTKTVPGFGPVSPVVMVIGEGPGADEDRSGLPFVGPAGKLLDKMLAAIRLSRHSNCFIGNVVKCRPPHNRDPKPEESEACARFLHEQIDILKPKMILAVGRIAAQNLLQTSDGIGKLRGRFFSYRGIPLMSTYHPSALLRDESLKKPAWEDLKLFRSRLSELAPGYAESFTND